MRLRQLDNPQKSDGGEADKCVYNDVQVVLVFCDPMSSLSVVQACWHCFATCGLRCALSVVRACLRTRTRCRCLDALRAQRHIDRSIDLFDLFYSLEVLHSSFVLRNLHPGAFKREHGGRASFG